MKVHITVVYEYEIPDDAGERFLSYGVDDPEACVRVDMDNFEQQYSDYSEYADVVHTEFSIVGPTNIVG